MALTQFVSERKTFTELLEIYKDNPCLWDSNHPLFGNKSAREQALSVMLDKYKVLIVDANMDTLKKKIEILRTSYRREYKKVLCNRNHKPSLWYYNLMTFLDEGNPAAATICHSEDEVSGTDVNCVSELRQLLIRKNPDDQHKPKRFKKSSVFLTQHSDPEETHPIKTDRKSETDAFGRALGLQLAGLTQMQKIIAEKLISDVMYYSRLEKLTTETSLMKLYENDDYYEGS